MHTYNPVRARNIALEMATAQADAGRTLTKKEFASLLGISEEKVEQHAPKAGEIYSQLERGMAA